MPARILVTGASGFAGSHLLERLVGHGDVSAWSRSKAPLSPGVLWNQVDLLDRQSVRRAIGEWQPDTVYHCAGSPHVASSWQNATAPLASNVMGTHHLLDALHAAGRPCRLLLTGSATVYAPSALPINETHAVAPKSPYALSKFAQERLTLRAIVEDGIDAIVARSFNHTGPRQSPDFVAPSMARQVALIEKGLIDPVLKVGNLEARRDFTDVRDVVSAYVSLMEKGQSGGVYNVASGAAPSMRELLDGLLARARVPIRVETDASRMRPHDIPVLVGDSSKLRATTGWTPAIGFERMLDDLLDYWRTVTVGSRQ